MKDKHWKEGAKEMTTQFLKRLIRVLGKVSKTLKKIQKNQEEYKRIKTEESRWI